jgi:hypothetical protein
MKSHPLKTTDITEGLIVALLIAILVVCLGGYIFMGNAIGAQVEAIYDLERRIMVLANENKALRANLLSKSWSDGFARGRVYADTQGRLKNDTGK